MTHILLLLSLAGGIIGAWLFVLAVKKGLLDDVEEIKFLVFRDQDEEDA
mgnify:CR=1 FL=1